MVSILFKKIQSRLKKKVKTILPCVGDFDRKFLVISFNISSIKMTGIEKYRTAFHSVQLRGVTRKIG